MKTWVEIAASLGVFGWLARMFLPIIHQFFVRLEAETRNSVLFTLSHWAQQVVLEVEKSFADYKGSNKSPLKKEEAVKLLTERIQKNHIIGYFPPEVISEYIEEAVVMMKKGKK